MPDASNFASRENKELLWNVLYENNAFDGIPKENVARVQELFEQSIVSMETTEGNLITLNKNFIAGFVQKVDGFKKRSVPLTHGRKEQVDSQFQSKQQELTKLLNPKPPKTIDFADSDDQPLDSRKIDDMLEATRRQRELDLELRPPPENSVEHKWLSGEKATMSETSRNIKIGEEISNDASDINIDVKPAKKVAWADENNMALSSDSTPLQDNFFQKLKPKPSSSAASDMSDRLKHLEKKVDEIHDMLRQLIDKQS